MKVINILKKYFIYLTIPVISLCSLMLSYLNLIKAADVLPIHEKSEAIWLAKNISSRLC